MSDVPLSSAKLVEQLGHLELAQKRLGLTSHAAGVRLAIVEVLHMVEEAGKTTPAETEPSPLSVRAT